MLDAMGNCSQCGEPPARKVGTANVVVKEVLGSTVIEKLTCRTAVGFWQWNPVSWPSAGCCGSRDHNANPNGWKALALLSVLCLVTGLAAVGAHSLGAPALVVTALFVASYISGAWDAATESRGPATAGRTGDSFSHARGRLRRGAGRRLE